ncbi:MAG: DUF2332 family protein [Thermoleophilaceae bacterium]|nr:DUF2332 family protein [Thermoleophilaceae bacterium]
MQCCCRFSSGFPSRSRFSRSVLPPAPCLLPDRYAYRYGTHGVGASHPVFACTAHCRVPLPHHLPEIVWRAGIDVDPIDVTNDDAVRWLEAFVWPDQRDRVVRLRRAVEIARRRPPQLVRGDLVDCLEAVAGLAPQNATLVIFHTAALAYLDLE